MAKKRIPDLNLELQLKRSPKKEVEKEVDQKKIDKKKLKQILKVDLIKMKKGLEKDLDNSDKNKPLTTIEEQNLLKIKLIKEELKSREG